MYMYIMYICYVLFQSLAVIFFFLLKLLLTFKNCLWKDMLVGR